MIQQDIKPLEELAYNCMSWKLGHDDGSNNQQVSQNNGTADIKITKKKQKQN